VAFKAYPVNIYPAPQKEYRVSSFGLFFSLGAFKRGASPSFLFLPLSLIGEGDTGGEVDKRGR